MGKLWNSCVDQQSCHETPFHAPLQSNSESRILADDDHADNDYAGNDYISTISHVILYTDATKLQENNTILETLSTIF